MNLWFSIKNINEYCYTIIWNQKYLEFKYLYFLSYYIGNIDNLKYQKYLIFLKIIKTTKILKILFLIFVWKLFDEIELMNILKKI